MDSQSFEFLLFKAVKHMHVHVQLNILFVLGFRSVKIIFFKIYLCSYCNHPTDVLGDLSVCVYLTIFVLNSFFFFQFREILVLATKGCGFVSDTAVRQGRVSSFPNILIIIQNV